MNESPRICPKCNKPEGEVDFYRDYDSQRVSECKSCRRKRSRLLQRARRTGMASHVIALLQSTDPRRRAVALHKLIQRGDISAEAMGEVYRQPGLMP